MPINLTPPPWIVANGTGNVVCAGNDPARPGQILFVLRGPMGTSEPYPQELLAEYAALIVEAVNATLKTQRLLPNPAMKKTS